MQKSFSLTLKFRISNLRGVTRHICQIYFCRRLSNLRRISIFYPLDNFFMKIDQVNITHHQPTVFAV
jgi:hypothetical protein